MIKLIQLANAKGWDHEKEIVRIGIAAPSMHVSDTGVFQADISEAARAEVSYFSMRQIERWLMLKHDIYISINYVVINEERHFDYFINIPNRAPIATFKALSGYDTCERNDSADKALYNALKTALETLPDK